MTSQNMDTKLVTVGRKKRYQQGSVNPVIQRASSLVFDTVQDKKIATRDRAKGGLFYGRRGTLTHFALQEAMAELEGGVGCALYPCGSAAIANTILSFVKTGDHVLLTETAYEPTQDFSNIILADLGVETQYYPQLIGAGIKDLIKENTSIVFLEAPGSVTMEVPDIPAMVKAIREVNPEIIIILDNTWAAGILFDALAHGVDISVQAGTKYIVGHSDAMLGTAVSNERCWDRLRERSYLMGQMIDADTAYVALRGLRTMGLRLKHHQESSIKIAQWLSERPEVEVVNHPALPECKGHEFYKKSFKGSCGLFSIILKEKLSQEKLEDFLDNFTHFSMAYSWGGYESLVLANQPEEIAKIRPLSGADFKGTLVRLHIGLEDPQDLIEDLERGFERLAAK